MAKRTLSTRLAIEGEAEYKASISRINGELKNLQSALKLAESEFKGQANSIDALKSKGEALNRLHEQQTKKVTEFQKALENARKAADAYAQKKEELTKKIAENEKALEELKQSTGDTTEEQAKLTAENEKLNAELAQNEKYLAAAEKGVNGWETQLNNAKADLNDLNGEIKDNDKYLDEAAKSADGCATSIDEFGKETKTAKDGVDALAQALAAAGIAKAAQEIAEMLWSCSKASAGFESAMAGVAKTTDMSVDELGTMGESIKELSTRIPIASTELAGIAEVAGQLGIAQEDLLGFTETMANLGTATNMTAEEAATMLARFANVTGMDASSFENLGSVIVALGNSFATTETDITAMGQRLAAAGTLAGLTEPEIMALAASMSSVGIEAEAGGTAMTQTFNAIETAVAKGGDDVGKFAEIAGMSAQEFSTAWQTSPITAIQAFISGLGGLEQKGESAVLVLDDLGLSGVRQGNMLKSLGLASDVLSDSIDMANTAWEENTALVKEAETRYSTTESKLAMFKNSVENVKIAVGDQLNPALGNLAEIGTDAMEWAEDLIQNNEWLAPTITAVAAALGVCAIALAGYTIATNVAIPAIEAFNKAISSNPIGIVILALAAAAAALAVLVPMLAEADAETEKITADSKALADRMNENAAAIENNASKMQAQAKQADQLVDRLDALSAKTNLTKSEQIQMQNAVDRLNESYPDLNAQLKLTTDEFGNVTGAVEVANGTLRESIDVMHERLKAKAQEEMLLQLYKDQADAELQLATIDAKRESILLGLNEEQRKAIQSLADMPDLFVNGAMATAGFTKEQRDAVESLDELTKSEEELQEALDETNGAVAVMEERTNALAGSAEELGERYTGLVEKYGELSVSKEEYIAATEKMTEAELAEYEATLQNTDAQAAASTVIQQMSGDITALAESYKTAYEAATESLEGQFSLWEEVGEVTATSLQTMQDGLDSQQTYWDDYGTNLDSLLSRGIEGIDEFAQNFVDGSTESAASLAGFAQMSDEEIMGLMESMSAIQTKREEIAGDIAGITADLEGGLSTLIETYITGIQDMTGAAGTPDFSAFITAVETTFGDVGVQFEGIGGDAGSGLADGIEASRGGVETASTGMGQGLIDAMRAVLDSHSPSQVMVDIGGDVVDGLVEGIESGKGELVSAFEELGEEIAQISEDSARDLVERYIQEFSQISERNRREMDSLKRTITDSMSSVPGEMTSIGSQIVDGMINGLNNRSSSLYSTVRSIVNSAISAARRAADTASPSKKTTKIFEDVGEGMVLGLEHKRQKVADTAQGVVDNALTLDTSKITAAIEQMPRLDTSQIDAVIQSINDHAPDLSAPGSAGAGGTVDQSTVTNNTGPVFEGDINVDVTVQGVDEQQAAEVGVTIGEEIKRQLRYRGVV